MINKQFFVGHKIVCLKYDILNGFIKLVIHGSDITKYFEVQDVDKNIMHVVKSKDIILVQPHVHVLAHELYKGESLFTVKIGEKTTTVLEQELPFIM